MICLKARSIVSGLESRTLISAAEWHLVLSGLTSQWLMAELCTVGGTCIQLEEGEIPGSGLTADPRAFPNLATLVEHPLWDDDSRQTYHKRCLETLRCSGPPPVGDPPNLVTPSSESITDQEKVQWSFSAVDRPEEGDKWYQANSNRHWGLVQKVELWY